MIPQGTSLVLGETFIDEGKATKLGRDEQSTIEALSCEQHKEADSHIFAHTAYATFLSYHLNQRLVSSSILFTLQPTVTALNGRLAEG